jgi:gliding motility-associated-like protein
MKKITLLLAFLCFSLLANAQATCTQTFTATGLDNDPTVLTINAVDLTCNGAGTITALQLINGVTSGNCAADGSDWYNFSLSVDGGIPIVGCGVDFSNIDITGFTTLTITSADTDNWAAGDTVSVSIDVEVTFTPTTPPSCDSTLTSPINGDTAAAVDGVIVWSAASGGATGYNLTVGTTSGGNEVLTTTLGNVTTYNLGVLNSGTTYYITIESFNANGTATGCTEQTFTTYTPVPGDACAIAIPIACGGSDSGTTVGATSYDAPTGFCGTGTGAPGVWYSITGNGDLLTASLCGSAYDTKIQVYEGACGAFTCVDGNDDSCNFQSEVSFPSVDGTDYFIYVYGFGSDTGAYTLDLTCTPIEDPITTDITTYTAEQLVTDILIEGDCAVVTNIQASSHSTGANIGYSYFTDGGSSFPFEDGVILSSGSASNAEGPFFGFGAGDGFGGPGDADLEAITGVTNTNDASYIEFDFVPIAPQIQFNFLMASTEYNGGDECTYADSFAFILTEISTGTVTNLAVLPTTDSGDDSIVVTNIHPEVTGFFGCPAVNEQYFEEYTSDYGVINYGGRTVPLTAFSLVNPGEQYHIKLVMADQGDDFLDTAIFIEGGSFSLGNLDLGDDVFLGDPNAICEGDVTTLNAGVLPSGTFITWYQDGVEVAGSTVVNPATLDTEQILEIDVTGDYTASITFDNTTCSSDATVHIEFYPKPTPDLGDTIIKCAGDSTILNANVGNLSDPNMSLPLDYVWEYRPNASSAWATITGATSDTYTIGATTVIASTNPSAGVVQYDNPVTGGITYVNVVNDVYELGDFRVTATDLVTGCSDVSDVHVNFYENANCVDIPTGLSPNGDGVNDCLVLDDLEDLQNISKFQVFNRYGTKVFESGAYIREWCGTNDDGDELKTGTYYYILDFEDGRTPIRSWIYINVQN